MRCGWPIPTTSTSAMFMWMPTAPSVCAMAMARVVRQCVQTRCRSKTPSSTRRSTPTRVTAAERPGLTPALPVDYWFNGDFAETLSADQPDTYTSLEQMFEKGVGTRTAFQFVSPDSSLFIPANAPIVQGEPYFGTKWAP